ncbi:MAG: hypothetical protein PVJ09_01615 [Candidatus Woesebacteria bacterium]|jgi:hypothetical protein
MEERPRAAILQGDCNLEKVLITALRFKGYKAVKVEEVGQVEEAERILEEAKASLLIITTLTGEDWKVYMQAALALNLAVFIFSYDQRSGRGLAQQEGVTYVSKQSFFRRNGLLDALDKIPLNSQFFN